MMNAQQQAAQAARQLAQQQRQAAAAAKQQQQLGARQAAQNARYAQQLAIKSTPAKHESNGFNLDSLGSPQAIDQLAVQYDQVQFKNANQSLLLQRAVSGQTVTPAADVNAGGVLQVVPDAGPKFDAYQKAQAAAAPKGPNLLILAGGAVLVLGAVFLLRR